MTTSQATLRRNFDDCQEGTVKAFLLNRKKIQQTKKATQSSGSTNQRVKQKIRQQSSKGYIFGNSGYRKKLMKQIDLVAPWNFSVIIYGESGYREKESYCQNSQQVSEVAKLCGDGLRSSLKEDCWKRTFGHEKGSFTGALNQKISHFELANGGTLFLDEIANLSYSTGIVTRVVQEQKSKAFGRE
jgi:two-component system response regulator HydG